MVGLVWMSSRLSTRCLLSWEEGGVVEEEEEAAVAVVSLLLW